MRFWDSSALILLAVAQPGHERLSSLLRQDAEIAAWWASPVECHGAVARLERERLLDSTGRRQIAERLTELFAAAVQIQPSDELRRSAMRLLDLHALRASDALQLAAALDCCDREPGGFGFVCLDEKLRTAAVSQGFEVLPLPVAV